MKKIFFAGLLRSVLLIIFLFCFYFHPVAQVKATDVTTPLHLLKPDYIIPYGAPAIGNVKQVLKRVYKYLDLVTPAQFVDKRTQAPLANLVNADTNTIIKPGDFRLTSYEWGVTYSGMLLAGEATGDTAYTNYTKKACTVYCRCFANFPGAV